MRRLGFLLLVCVFLCSCGGNADISGSGTGVGNGATVSGMVVDTLAQPMSSAALELVPVDFLKPDTHDRQAKVFYSTSNETGGFTFRELDTGTYKLWGKGGAGLVALLSISIVNDSDKISLNKIEMKSPVHYAVRLVGGDDDDTALLRIYGSTFSQTLKNDSVVILSLPEGPHYADISVEKGTILNGDSLLLKINDTIDVHLLSEGVFSKSYSTDSLIVEKILSINEIHSTVEAVTDAPLDDDDGGKRVVRLSLENISLLPSIVGALRMLEILEVENGSVAIVPQEIGNLQNLKVLDLSDNQIQSLPDGITSLDNVDSLDLIGNPLDSLSDSVKNWIADIVD